MDLKDDYILLDSYLATSTAIERVLASDPTLSHMTLTGSSGRGWSRMATLQRCAREFYYSYVHQANDAPATLIDGSTALAVGSGVHACLAIYYTFSLEKAKWFWGEVQALGIDPAVASEVSRIFLAYVDYYGNNDYLIPIAAEVRSADEETGDTCRYDLIARIDNPPLGELPGYYCVEHKTAGRFDRVTLDGWDIHGEILGEFAFWKTGGFEAKYGPLQGICVNLIGKQKSPQFHRSFIHPTQKQLDNHRFSLKYFRKYEMSLLQSDMKPPEWPMSEANCIGQYGFCRYYDRCRDNQ